jgi:hypothetical protein
MTKNKNKIKDNNYNGNLCKKLFFDSFTGKTNDIFDIGRILWALSVLFYLGLSTADVIMTKNFEYQDFGIGLGAVLAGGGAAIGFKKSTEPGN